MYTLGQLARAVWPSGDMPAHGVIDKLLSSPSVGLPMLLKTKPARELAKQHPETLGALVDKLPTELPDIVPVTAQGPFWLGYYHFSAAIERSASLGPEHIERAGRHLFGDRWQTDLARALGVGDRRVREWMSGARRPPAGVWADIAALLRQRGNEGIALLTELDQ